MPIGKIIPSHSHHKFTPSIVPSRSTQNQGESTQYNGKSLKSTEAVKECHTHSSQTSTSRSLPLIASAPLTPPESPAPSASSASQIHALKPMPDIAKKNATIPLYLEWVGMEELCVPLQLKCKEGNASITASVDSFVDLQKEFQGIHMSRLYQKSISERAHQELNPQSLQAWVREMASTHRTSSENAQIKIKFNYLMQRPSLVSGNFGWNQYPCIISCTKTKENLTLEMSVTVQYSSTCPCSTALAKQSLLEGLNARFTGESISKDELESWLPTYEVPTPHSQRSTATVIIKTSLSLDIFPIEELIEGIENTLGTAVQTMVKREDEKAFTILNGKNLMFCEDAARKIKQYLNANKDYKDFHIYVKHHESLHGHNAVSVTTKELPNGYKPFTNL